jgi:uncharacterized protein YecE (DUF72 family)
MDVQLGLFPDEPAPEPASPVGAASVPPALRDTAHRIPTTVRLGTSSWSFPGWDGIVYDRPASQSTLARHGLEAYARHPLLRAVGIDRTYYGPLKTEDFARYAEAVPSDFRFLVKANRLLTSPTKPEGFGVRDVNPYFLDPLYAVHEVVGPMWEGLGRNAGPLLFQFSPVHPNVVGGRGPFFERLHRFLDALPEGPLYAVELRTPALLTSEYAELLDAVGAAHCYNVHPAMAPLERQLEVLSPFYQPALVVRWMLHAGLRYEVARDRYEPFDRIVDEDLPSRERIAMTVLDATVAERDAFVIVNNKAEGSSPLSVFRLAERIAGWEPGRPPDEPHQEQLSEKGAPGAS